MDSTSPTLLQRVRSRSDEQAWDRFVKLYTPFLFHCCRRLGLSEPDAGDVVQEVFLALLAKLPEFTYSPDGSFRAWLRTVTVNKCRERYRRQTEQARGGSGAGLSQIEDDDPSGAWWDDEYRRQLVVRALEIMQTDFESTSWKACWLTTVEDRPVAEVAVELQISPNAVYVARSRVLRCLRNELRDVVDV